MPTFKRVNQSILGGNGNAGLNTLPRRSTLILVLLGGILAVSTASIFIRFAQHAGASSIVIAAFRLTLATLGLAPFALSRYRSDLRFLTRREWFLALLSGVFLAFHFAFWITSLQYTSVASSVVLVTTTPLWVAILAPLVLRERIGLYTYIGLALALAGGTIVGLSDACSWQASSLACPPAGTFFAGTAFLGDFLSLAGAWMAAGYMLVGRNLRAKINLIPYIFVVYGMAATVLIAIMFGLGESPLVLTPVTYLWLVLLALVPQLLGHSIFNWSLKYIPASLVSVVLMGEPVGSTVLAYFILQEQPGLVKIIGAILILAGIWLTARSGMGSPDS
jgi:drug/metabolite transporter (DMT)-like permease